MGVTSIWQSAGVMHQASGAFVEFEHQTDEDIERQVRPATLVVDDSTDIALMLVMILQQAGYEAVMSTSAVEALKLADTKHFDLVISDIAMPDMDGYSLAKALRSRPEYEKVPLIAVTGFDQYDDRERALSAGFNTQIRKPIDPTSFIDLIRKIS